MSVHVVNEDESCLKSAVTVIELSDEQKEHILNSGEFSKFFDKATRLMERALCETVDITFDYSGAEAEETEGYAVLLVYCRSQMFHHLHPDRLQMF